ncbi:hypothetical protein B0H11DRAFT_2260190 [Mycena galericulata]|nr:hypothetical protein B0H11DRAFT_2260190 [Mycena galericulata]
MATRTYCALPPPTRATMTSCALPPPHEGDGDFLRAPTPTTNKNGAASPPAAKEGDEHPASPPADKQGDEHPASSPADNQGDGHPASPPADREGDGFPASPPANRDGDRRSASPPADRDGNGRPDSPPADKDGNGHSASPPGDRDGDGRSASPPGDKDGVSTDVHSGSGVSTPLPRSTLGPLAGWTWGERSRGPSQPPAKERRGKEKPGAAALATQKEKMRLKHERDAEFEEELGKVDEIIKKAVVTIASKFSKEIEDVDKAIRAKCFLAQERSTNLWNAKVHRMSKIMNEGLDVGSKHPIQDIQKAVKTYEPFQDMDTEDEEELLTELREAQGTVKTGTRLSNAAAARDCTAFGKRMSQEINAVHKRTGAMLYLVVARGDLADTIVPQMIASEGMEDYFRDVHHMTTEYYLERVDNWTVNRGKLVDPENYVELKKDIVKRMQKALEVHATGKGETPMQYANFKKMIALRNNVDISGWPDAVPFKSPSDLDHQSVRTIHQLLVKEKICFIPLSPERRTQYEAEVAEEEKAKKAKKEEGKKEEKKRKRSKSAKGEGEDGDDDKEEEEVEQDEAAKAAEAKAKQERKTEMERVKKARWRAKRKAEGHGGNDNKKRRLTTRKAASKAKSAAYVESSGDEEDKESDEGDEGSDEEEQGTHHKLLYSRVKVVPAALAKVMSRGRASNSKSRSKSSEAAQQKPSRSHKSNEARGKRKRDDDDGDEGQARKKKKKTLSSQLPPGMRSISQIDDDSYEGSESDD